ncbi:ABC transporter permease [Demequina sp.]|uniref:ABC transporter permease n=1 Tax=Demequina sp. TaxID=2050685 RepID=UPI003D0EDF03
MFRLALKSVKQKPGRLILTAIAVALGVSLVAATFTFTSALRSGFNDLFENIYGSTDVVVEQDPNAQIDEGDPFEAGDAIFTADDVTAVQAVDGVEIAHGGMQLNAMVMPKEDTGQPSFGGTQMFNWYGDPRIDLSTIVDGHGPEADSEIVLDLDGAESLGYAIGDTVRVSTEEGVEEFTLVGTVRFGADNDLQGAVLAFVTDAAAEAIQGEPGFSTITVVTAEGANKDDVVAGINQVIPDGTRAITGEDKVEEQVEQMGTFLNYINIFAIAFGLIALFVGSYIIVNTFRIIVTQRTREFGLLRAIGATGKQVRATVLAEATILGIVGSTLGIIVGYLFALAAAGLVKLIGADLLGTVTLPLTAVLWSYVLGLIVTLGAAIAPAIHASQISPMEALREAATDSRKPLARRNVVGGALALLGVVAVIVGLYTGVAKPFIYVGAGAVLLVLGATLLAAQVLVPLAYGLRGVLTAWMGVDGKLAANNIHREPRRSSNTAAAIMIGVMLLALTSTFTESLKATLTSQFQQMHAQIIVVGTQGAIPQGAIDIIEANSDVDAVTILGVDPVRFDGENYTLTSFDADTIDKTIDIPTEPALGEIDGGVYVDPVIEALGVKVGDEITLEGDEGSVTLPVTGTYANDDGSHFWVDWETGTELVGEPDILQALVLLNEGADADEVQSTLEDALADEYPAVLLQQPDQLQQLISTVIDFILAVISALLLTALLIALLGVANTLLLSVTERTREIGLLRAVGLKRGSIWKMITIESMVMAIFGTILGMILGVGLGSALVLSLEDQGFNGVAIPWFWLAVYTVLAAIAGVLAAIWPAWRASRLDILQAIAADG